MPETGSPEIKGRPSLGEVALFGCCPRCRSRTVFDTLAEVAPCCRVCGLDFSKAQGRGRSAMLITVIVAVVLVSLALWLDEAVRPPMWVHLVLWIPLTVSAVLAGLRFLKALLVMKYAGGGVASSGTGSSEA